MGTKQMLKHGHIYSVGTDSKFIMFASLDSTRSNFDSMLLPPYLAFSLIHWVIKVSTTKYIDQTLISGGTFIMAKFLFLLFFGFSISAKFSPFTSLSTIR